MILEKRERVFLLDIHTHKKGQERLRVSVPLLHSLEVVVLLVASTNESVLLFLIHSNTHTYARRKKRGGIRMRMKAIPSLIIVTYMFLTATTAGDVNTSVPFPLSTCRDIV